MGIICTLSYTIQTQAIYIYNFSTMKNILAVIALLFCSNIYAQEDYILKINDSIYKVALDKMNEVVINGKKISISISISDTLTYSDELFTFQYPKEFSITKTKIDKGVDQFVILTAEGTGIIIQKYLTLNPSKLNDIMLAEVTKEKLNYGYTEVRDKYKRTLKSGQALDTDRSILTYKEDKAIFEIMSYGKKDEGILIITMLSSEDRNDQGKKMINLIWNTLQIK